MQPMGEKGRPEMEGLFETERLIIRPFRLADAQALYENHVDDAVRTWFPNECYQDVEEAGDAIRFYAACVEKGQLPFVLGAEEKATGELIGDAGFSQVEGKPREVEVGYCVGCKYRRRGYAAELLRGISDYIAARFSVGVIYGRVVHGNEGSVKVLEKNGYQFVGEAFGEEDDPYGKGMLIYKKEFPNGSKTP